MIVQLAPAANEGRQFCVTVNIPAFAPERATLVIGNVTVPLFVTVTACEELVVPCNTVPKPNVVGDTV